MKVLECSSVDPSSGCDYVVRGETEEDIFRGVSLHAKEHGIREVTPELLAKVKENIHEG